MNAAVARKKIESVMARSFRRAFDRHEEHRQRLPTGVAELNVSAGFPRGAITEIHGNDVVRAYQLVAFCPGPGALRAMKPVR